MACRARTLFSVGTIGWGCGCGSGKGDDRVGTWGTRRFRSAAALVVVGKATKKNACDDCFCSINLGDEPQQRQDEADGILKTGAQPVASIN